MEGWRGDREGLKRDAFKRGSGGGVGVRAVDGGAGSRGAEKSGGGGGLFRLSKESRACCRQ